MAERATNLAAVLTEWIGPPALAHERLVEVLPALRELLPQRGLRRGTTLAVGGQAALSLALALAAQASTDGAWVGIIGVPSVGLAAAAELGVALERVFLVATPPARQWAEVVTAVADGAEVVVAGAPESVRTAEIRRVQARLQARGAVLVLVGAAAGWSPELQLTASPLAWEGIGDGHGRLLARRVLIELDGRRAGRPVRREYWLPGPNGGVDEVGVPAVPLHPPAAS